MNKFAASLGLLALGTTALHAVEATALNPMQSSKPWSVAASLRGFYDDNINLSPTKVDSFGMEISPSVNFGLAGEQTSFNLGYQLDAKWFDTRPAGQQDSWTFNNTFEGDFDHKFSSRASVSVRDSFIIGNEPDSLRTPLPNSTFQYLSSNDNIINYGAIDFNLEASELLGFNIGYNNGYFNYAEDDGTPAAPSTAALLNRIENRFNIDSQWKLTPQTVGILGYMYGQNLYTGDEPIGAFVDSSSKDSRSQTFYVGAQHAFAPTVTGVAKVGAQYFDYYGSLQGGHQWSPYVNASLKYQYRTTTTMDFGFSYSRSASDVAANGVATPLNYVKDTEVALLYGTLSQELATHFVATAMTTLQHATYNGGGAGVDDESYLFFQIGLDLAYQFTPNFSGHVGYNFETYNTDVVSQSDYNRNRVYIGITAAY